MHHGCEVQRQSTRHNMSRHNLGIRGRTVASQLAHCCMGFQKETDHICTQARPFGSVVANHTQEFFLMSIDVSRADHHVKALRFVSRQLLEDGGGGGSAGQTELLTKSRHGTRDAASNCEGDRQEYLLRTGVLFQNAVLSSSVATRSRGPQA